MYDGDKTSILNLIEIFVELANIITRYKAAGNQLRLNLQGSRDTVSDSTVEGSDSLDEEDTTESDPGTN